MTEEQNDAYTYTLQGQNQVQIVLAMMLKNAIPFMMAPENPEQWRWYLTVHADHKPYIQRFALVASEILLEDDEGDRPAG